MSTGVVSLENRNLGTALQIAWQTLSTSFQPSFHNLLGKLLSLAVICYAGWLSRCTPKSDYARKDNCADALLPSWLLLSSSRLASFYCSLCRARRACRESLEGKDERRWSFISLCCFVLLVVGFGLPQWASITETLYSSTLLCLAL